MISIESFNELFPNAVDAQEWVDAMAEHLVANQINTTLRLAAFVSQCGHESGGWRVFEENLNYSQQGLRSVFKKYFPTDELAAEYARKPQQIASRVYANRMGNGSEESGDGWKYRGRGIIQLTGKANYERFSHQQFGDHKMLATNPDLLKTDKNISLLSALWFWNQGNINIEADKGDIKRMTQKINGGQNGLAERIELYNHAMQVLS